MFGFFDGPKCPECGKKIDKTKKHCSSCGIYIVENNITTPFTKEDFPGFNCIYLYHKPLESGEYPILKCLVKHNTKACSFVFTNHRLWVEPIFTFSTDKSFETELKELVSIQLDSTGKSLFLEIKDASRVEIVFEEDLDIQRCFGAMKQALQDVKGDSESQLTRHERVETEILKNKSMEQETLEVELKSHKQEDEKDTFLNTRCRDHFVESHNDKNVYKEFVCPPVPKSLE